MTNDDKMHVWTQQFHSIDEYARIIQTQGMKIVDIKSGSNQTLILTHDGLVYRVDHHNADEDKFKITQLKKQANIVAIQACCSHFLALERLDSEPII